MPLVLFLEIEIVQVYQYPQWMFHGTPAQWNMMRWPRKSYFPRPNKFEKLCGLYLPLLVKQSILKVPGNATVKGIFFLFNSVFPTFSWPWSLPLPHSDVTRGTSFFGIPVWATQEEWGICFSSHRNTSRGTKEWSHIIYFGVCHVEAGILSAQDPPGRGKYFHPECVMHAGLLGWRGHWGTRASTSSEPSRVALGLSKEGWGNCKSRHAPFFLNVREGGKHEPQIRKGKTAVSCMAPWDLCSHPISVTDSDLDLGAVIQTLWADNKLLYW